ncbi:MAG: GNAT family N-acetyltransferase [Myxococcales bacterium]|nr:GNAT family N-acetyltransferase [Myxococcales bacterium]MCB9754314.1 GNAT family N-acetyltransferase [Myxococcales bacterium]
MGDEAEHAIAPHFDADYRESAILRDGSRVELRLVRPTDKGLLVEGFAGLSPQSRYQRFLTAKPRLTTRELAYLTELDGARHLAIGALTRDERGREHPLGVGRLVIEGDTGAIAEPAVTVIDAAQGRGLGSLLLQRLIAAARERGVRRFACDVLASNRAALALLREAAPDVDVTIAGGVARVEFLLPDVGAEHPHAEPPRRSGVYRYFVAIAEGALELVRRLDRLRG